MKPIEFMNALSDVNDVYVREMLDEAQMPAASGGESSAVTSRIVQCGTNAQTVSGSRQKSGSENLFSSKLRYPLLIASAAACFAIFAGIMHLHHSTDNHSFVADSLISEIDEIENVTGTTVSTEDTVSLTTVTAAETADKLAVTTVTTLTDTKPEQTEASTATAQVTDTTPQPDQSTAAITSSTVTTTESTSEATIETTTTDPTSATRKQTVPYTQSYLLGDIDMDGDITLIDYFIARRNWTKYNLSDEYREIDNDAFDRGNVDRVIGDTDQNSPISLDDTLAIFEIAVCRKWFGMPDMTYETYMQMYEGENSEEFAKLMTSFYVFNEDGFTDGLVLTGDTIPKEVRDFYNDAHIIEQTFSWMEGVYDFRFCNWSQAEFDEQMDVLRQILARN